MAQQPRPLPTAQQALLFAVKVRGLRLRRALQNVRSQVPRHARGDLTGFPFVLAESRTALRTEQDPRELRLQMGKIQNLRVAAKLLDGLVIPAGEIFSFWSQIGNPTTRRGFVQGRQVQQGCVIPAIGGGICQLSNALYDVAQRAGFEILERHRHTRALPRTAAALGRDATVAWNYVDLRFRAKADYALTVRLSPTELIVRLHGQAPALPKTPLSDYEAFRGREVDVQSCETCGEGECFRHQRMDHAPVVGRTAALVDQVMPEFAPWVRHELRSGDLLLCPIQSGAPGMRRYAWSCEAGVLRRFATACTLRRSWVSRRLAQQGAERQIAALRFTEQLSRRYSKHLTFDVERLIVAQPLLPFLWSEGVLAGRYFDVLMHRLPLDLLHQELDQAIQRHPDRLLLADYRAPEEIVRWEREALEAADRLISPHRNILSCFGEDRTEQLDWAPGRAIPWTAGNRLIFPGPAVSRKGAYEVRDVALQLSLPVTLIGANLEGDDFWKGVTVERPVAADRWLDGALAVVQPAVLEDQPRRLLTALASGVPVIATEACGLPPQAGLFLIPPGDSEALSAAIKSIRLMQEP
jgi:hypothetical protein